MVTAGDADRAGGRHADDVEGVLAAVGDVVLARDDPGRVFDLVRDELAAADLRICNLEVALSHEGVPQPHKLVTLHASPAMIDAYVAGGFDVVSLANNHTMDYGPLALLDTMALLDARGIRHVGAGPERAAAWRPLVHRVGAVAVAFVSFASEVFSG